MLEPVAVLPVAEYERLRGIEARLRADPRTQSLKAMDPFFARVIDDYRWAVLGEEKP